MPRSKGWVCSPEVRANMRAGALKRKSRIIARYGLSPEFYDSQVALNHVWCSTCKTFKPEDECGRSKSKCFPCQRIHNRANYKKNSAERNRTRREYFERNRASELRKRRNRSLAAYGISAEQYDELFAKQDGKCAICRQPEIAGRSLSVDHSHSCCKAQKKACDKCRRGLLCSRCNLFLEKVESTPGLAELAYAYLKQHGSIT